MRKRIVFFQIILAFFVKSLFGQSVALVPSEAQICPMEQVQLAASGALFYRWNSQQNFIEDSTIVVSPNMTTTYTVEGYNLSDTELVLNGDFEMGNVNFYSDYTYVTGYGSMFYGSYSITTDGQLIWGQDHLYGYGGTGQFLIIDGATTPNSVVWEQTVNIIPNTHYSFSANVASTFASNVEGQWALLQFCVNGETVGDVFHSPNVLNDWVQYYEIWYNDTATTATLTILNQNMDGLGNDFGLDNISFRELEYVGGAQSIIYVQDVCYPDNVMDVDCTMSADSNAFEMALKYEYGGFNSMSTPMVADMNGDGTPEIIAVKWNSESPNYGYGFDVINTQTNSRYTINTARFSTSGQCMTIADVDRDGFAELFVLGADLCIHSYHHISGNIWSQNWQSSCTISDRFLLNSADVNNDGFPEIVCGNSIFNAQTGTLLLQGNMVQTGMGFGSPHGTPAPWGIPYYLCALGDMDGDGTLELCAGNTIYKIVITNNNGTMGNSWTILRQAEANNDIVNWDGQTILVDFDGDGDLDVCVIGTSHDIGNWQYQWGPIQTINTYVWDGQSSTVISNANCDNSTYSNRYYCPSIPYSGDLDGNGLPEIVFSWTGVGMIAYTYDTTYGGNMYKMHQHLPFGETSGYTVFDFNQDGRNEIVYRGTQNLFIVDGSTLDNLCSPVTSFSGTQTEYPVVADVDGDGHAEIIVCSAYQDWGACNFSDWQGWVRVYSSAVPGAWSSARKVWNQWSYNSVNINEDLTVPQYMFDISTVFPNGKQPFNAFLHQMPYIDTQGNLFNKATDVAAISASISTNSSNATLHVTYTNQGDNMLKAPYSITVFVNQVGGEVIQTITINEPLSVGETAQQTATIPVSDLCQLSTLVVAINCAGGGIAQDGGLQPECDITNNTAQVVISQQNDPVFITETACDRFEWNGTIYTQSGDYEVTLINSFGCDSIVNLNLTINHSDTMNFNVSACENYTWNEQTYTSSGNYTHATINEFGCNRTEILNLDITSSSVFIHGKTSVYPSTDITSGIYQYNIDSTGINPANVHWSIDREDWLLFPNGASCNLLCTSAGQGILHAWTEGESCDVDTTLNINATFYGTEENETQSVSIYPNPTNGSVTVSWQDIVAVKVFNMLGQNMDKYNFVNQDEIVLDMQDYQKGVYLLEISSSNGKVYRSVVLTE